MFIVYKRAVALPLWTVAFGIAALSAPQVVIPSVVGLLSLTLAGCAAWAWVLGQRRRKYRPSRIEVLPRLQLDAAADVSRMESDAG